MTSPYVREAARRAGIRPFDTDRIDNRGVYRPEPPPVVAVTPFRVWFGMLILAAMIIGALLAFAP